MKAIVIYNSQTGFTKKYAEWISQNAGCECVEFATGSKMDLSSYDAIVFGGWCMAGQVTKLSWFKKQMPAWFAAGKKLIVFAVGATPSEAPEVEVAMKNLFTDEERKMVKAFYCQGGLDYDKMNWSSKKMMQLLVKVLKKNKNPTEDDKKKIELLSKSYDISDKKYIEEIVAELR